MKENLPPTNPSKKKQKHRIIRALLLAAGTISLALGAIGVVVPLLPTTPFLLLAAACYLRSSDRMHSWLINNKWFGSYIKNYQEGKGIPLKTKILAVSFLWITIIISAFFVTKILWVQIILLAIATGVSVHIIRLPTFKNKSD
jgi:uncharacterized membrane protein YbaN (DUF454 family)